MTVTSSCTALFVDINDDLYCSLTSQHRVTKTSLSVTTSTTRVAAGTGTPGSGPSTLDSPRGIFVHTNLDLYVADCRNDRIQLFRSGQLSGTTVVDSNVIQCPSSVVLDGDGYLYITSSDEDRIIRYALNVSECIFGCGNGGGSSPNQLSDPRGMSFDTSGNILVADTGNGRIQKILLRSSSCGEYQTSRLTCTDN